jgi:hypothetical protein
MEEQRLTLREINAVAAEYKLVLEERGQLSKDGLRAINGLLDWLATDYQLKSGMYNKPIDR